MKETAVDTPGFFMSFSKGKQLMAESDIRRGPVFLLAAGGMEICWLYAGATFTLFLAGARPFPLLSGAVTFTAAAALTALTRGRGWRRILLLLPHLAGMFLAAYGAIHAYFHHYWPPEPAVRLVEVKTGFIICALIAWTIGFWLSGRALITRPASYAAAIGRFDSGVGILATLTLMGTAVRMPTAAINAPLFPFFAFAIPAVAIARHWGSGRREMLPGRAGIGTIAAALTGTVLLGAGLALLFLPFLRAAAWAGYAVLSRMAAPLGPPLVAILRWLFGPRNRLTMDAGSDLPMGSQAASPIQPEMENPFFLKMLGWGMAGLLGLISLVMLAWLARCLWRWLTAKAPELPGNRPPSLLQYLLSFWRRFLDLLAASRGRRSDPAAAFYRRLAAWGRRRRMALRPSETPREYGERLERRYPGLARELRTIVAGFNAETYGGVSLTGRRLRPIAGAWRRIWLLSFAPGKRRRPLAGKGPRP